MKPLWGGVGAPKRMQQKKHAVIPEDIAGKHSSKRASSVRTRPIPVSFRVISIVPSTLVFYKDSTNYGWWEDAASVRVQIEYQISWA